MTNEKFIETAKALVTDYIIEHMDKTDTIPPFEVFVVWNAYILGNIKALVSTTIHDGMYYEVTYNKEKDEIYFDAYKKFENRKINPKKNRKIDNYCVACSHAKRIGDHAWECDAENYDIETFSCFSPKTKEKVSI